MSVVIRCTKCSSPMTEQVAETEEGHVLARVWVCPVCSVQPDTPTTPPAEPDHDQQVIQLLTEIRDQLRELNQITRYKR